MEMAATPVPTPGMVNVTFPSASLNCTVRLGGWSGVGEEKEGGNW